MTQLVSSLIIYFIGDCVAQSITQPEPSAQQQEPADEADEKGWVQQWSDDRDWARTARALAIGGLSAIPSYRWFLWLSNSFNYRSKTLSLSIKVRRLLT
jgi:protein Mpv17